MDRRHSHYRQNEEKSSKHYHVSQHNLDDSKKNTLGRGQWEKSLEEIKRGYSAIGCKFYQIWNPATQKYLQVDPENTSVGLTENVSSFNSKYTHNVQMLIWYKFIKSFRLTMLIYYRHICMILLFYIENHIETLFWKLLQSAYLRRSCIHVQII